jgi:hypothetical protein
MTKKNPAIDLIQQEAELIKAGTELQEQGLDLLVAEMHALASLIPGMPAPQHTEAETEEGFDNMPV